MSNYNKISEIEPELINLFKEYLIEEFGEQDDELTFKDLIETIRECGKEKKTVDYDYIYYDYKLKIGGYMFSCSGSEYLKDGGICPFEMDKDITIEEIKKKVPKPKPFKHKLLIIGNARHGKDTFAELLNEQFGLKFISSSQAAADIFIYDELKELYNYQTPEECYDDRFNHRAEWFNMICDYNKDDKARLAKGILELNDCYVGMRSRDEIEECMIQGLFDLIIWVDASERLPIENSDSFNIDPSCADIIVDNNGTFEEFKTKVIRIGKILSK